VQKTNEIKERIIPIIKEIAAGKVVKLDPVGESILGGIKDKEGRVLFSFAVEKMDAKLHKELILPVGPIGSNKALELALAGISYKIDKVGRGANISFLGERELIEFIHAHLKKQQEAQSKMQAQTV